MYKDNMMPSHVERMAKVSPFLKEAAEIIADEINKEDEEKTNKNNSKTNKTNDEDLKESATSNLLSLPLDPFLMAKKAQLWKCLHHIVSAAHKARNIPLNDWISVLSDLRGVLNLVVAFQSARR